MEYYKTYNLKLTKEAYFKLKELELKSEEKTGKKPTKSVLINELILKK